MLLFMVKRWLVDGSIRMEVTAGDWWSCWLMMLNDGHLMVHDGNIVSTWLRSWLVADDG